MLIQKLFATFSTYPSIRPSDYSGSVEKQKIIVSIPFVHGKRPFDKLGTAQSTSSGAAIKQSKYSYRVRSLSLSAVARRRRIEGRTLHNKIFDPAGVARLLHYLNKYLRFRWNRYIPSDGVLLINVIPLSPPSKGGRQEF
jgi:hypothetical protein